ncbi:unnamed protein product [[Candida] boidinii]|nr:unnamed protein product [[Candida] boidinii]
MSTLEREMRSQSRVSKTKRRDGSRTPSGYSNYNTEDEEDYGEELNLDSSFSKKLDELLSSRIETSPVRSDIASDNLSSRSPSRAGVGSSAIGNGSLSSRSSSVNVKKYNNIDEELNDDRSNSVSSVNSATKINGIADIITALTSRRTQVSSASREVLFAELYNMIVRNPVPACGEIINENDLNYLISFIKASRSEWEFILALRATVAYACSDIDEIATTVMESLFPYLLKKISPTSNTENITATSSTSTNISSLPSTSGGDEVSSFIRSSCIMAYGSLALVIMDGSGCAGIEEVGELLMDVIDGYSNSDTTKKSNGNQDPNNNTDSDDYDIQVVVNSLNTIGVILTLMFKGRNSTQGLDDFIQDNLSRVLPLLETGVNPSIQKSAARLTALMYEVFDYQDDYESGYTEDDDDDNSLEPYYDIDEVLNTINQLIRNSSKKVSKKDKKETRSVLRDVSKTIERYSTKEKRKKIFKSEKSEIDDDDDNNQLILGRLKLSKNKTFPITSWFQHIRIFFLRWIFSSGLHSHLANSKNSEIRELLEVNDERYSGAGGKGNTSYYDDVGDSNSSGWGNESKKTNSKTKTMQIRTARDLKLKSKFGDLSLEDNDL